MYNYFAIIGRVCNDIEVRDVGEGKRVANLRVAVNRPFKNMEGTYDTDFFSISLWEYLADQAKECLYKGAYVGIKGRLLPNGYENKDGVTVRTIDLIGEQFLFMDSRRQNIESDSEIEGLK